ncbi:hypothetical protein DL98DRAFT_434060 [Cadophora sp. DSE1049]|nr:hypothetical protein DL98DRAFT_434060 [Cadophora sp. DSE1049]
MPLVFADLAEATKYWELVLRRSCHFIMHGAQILEIDRWSSSFHKLLANGESTPPDLREVTNIALLRMTSLGTKIAVTGTIFTNETSYDVFIPEDPTLRREAIAILRMQQNDGHWDRFMIASIGSWIMGIEEEGWDGIGNIPEDSRVQLSKITMAIEEQSVMVQCVRRGAPEAGGESQAQEPSLTWVETVISGW